MVTRQPKGLMKPILAVTLGGELLGFEDGQLCKCLLRGDLDLETVREASLGQVIENISLTALTDLAAVVSTD
nr:hypothetical protein [Tanacetum cinerariifolium]